MLLACNQQRTKEVKQLSIDSIAVVEDTVTTKTIVDTIHGGKQVISEVYKKIQRNTAYLFIDLYPLDKRDKYDTVTSYIKKFLLNKGYTVKSTHNTIWEFSNPPLTVFYTTLQKGDTILQLTRNVYDIDTINSKVDEILRIET